jgi:hypothetical protein
VPSMTVPLTMNSGRRGNDVAVGADVGVAVGAVVGVLVGKMRVAVGGGYVAIGVTSFSNGRHPANRPVIVASLMNLRLEMVDVIALPLVKSSWSCMSS